MSLRRDEPRPGVLRLSIDRAQAANALDTALLDELTAAFASAGQNSEVRCIILCGTGGRSFSAGYDLSALSAETFRGAPDPIGPVCRAMQRCPQPIIACVNGHVFGGALEIACAADIRLFQQGSTIGIPAARFGICYAPAGVQRLRAALGSALTTRLLLSGQPLTVDELPPGPLGVSPLPSDTIDEQAIELASAIASAAPLAVQGMTEILRQLAVHPGGGENFERAHQANFRRALLSEDLERGLRALESKHKPRFEGR